MSTNRITNSLDHPINGLANKRQAVVDGAVAKIPLGGKTGLYALVDEIDSDLDRYSWSIGGRGYMLTSINSASVKLHHLVIGKPNKGFVVDHINRDPLDNRRANLRIVPIQINAINKSISKNNTSGTKGVSWHKGNMKWCAQMCLSGKHYVLGYFATKEEAAEARLKAELNNRVFKKALHSV